MKKKTQIIAIAILAVVGVLTYCHFRSDTPEVPAVNPEEIGTSTESAETAEPSPSPEASPVNGFLPTQMEDPNRFEALQKAIKDMNTCLGTKIAPLEEGVDFNYDALGRMIIPFMGDSVMQTSEWETTDIQTSSGEMRRIFLEYKSDIMSDSATSLKYYSIGENGEETQIPLSDEQVNDPSETLVASLEADGTVVSKSRSQRAFFQNGGNVVTVERNGKLSSFDVPFNEKRFRCEGLDSAAALKCSCL